MSQHLYGNATDIVVTGVTPGEVAAAAMQLGFPGVELYPTSTHLDVRLGSPARWVELS